MTDVPPFGPALEAYLAGFDREELLKYIVAIEAGYSCSLELYRAGLGAAALLALTTPAEAEVYLLKGESAA